MNRGQEEYGSNVTEKNKSDSILDLFLFLRLFMLALHFLRSIAWSLKYTGQPILKVLTFKGVTLSIHIEVKSCRTENNNCLVAGL